MVIRGLGIVGRFMTMIPWNQGTDSSGATGVPSSLDANTARWVVLLTFETQQVVAIQRNLLTSA
jgi:hypothetical protein